MVDKIVLNNIKPNISEAVIRSFFGKRGIPAPEYCLQEKGIRIAASAQSLTV